MRAAPTETIALPHTHRRRRRRRQSLRIERSMHIVDASIERNCSAAPSACAPSRMCRSFLPFASRAPAPATRSRWRARDIVKVCEWLFNPTNRRNTPRPHRCAVETWTRLAVKCLSHAAVETDQSRTHIEASVDLLFARTAIVYLGTRVLAHCIRIAERTRERSRPTNCTSSWRGRAGERLRSAARERVLGDALAGCCAIVGREPGRIAPAEQHVCRYIRRGCLDGWSSFVVVLGRHHIASAMNNCEPHIAVRSRFCSKNRGNRVHGHATPSPALASGQLQRNGRQSRRRPHRQVTQCLRIQSIGLSIIRHVLWDSASMRAHVPEHCCLSALIERLANNTLRV